MATMIITHTQNSTGQRRLYIGGKGSLECWLEPADDGSWTFKLDEAVTGNRIPDTDKHTWAIHTLARLADELDVSFDDLAAVPFETIAALHSSDPFAGRRVATGRRKAIDNGYLAKAPNIKRPQSDFRSSDYAHQRQR